MSSIISLKEVVSHAKEYGFIYPSSEIYEGLQSVYDYGPNGVALKKNIQSLWWDSMTKINKNIVGIDSAIFMHPRIWEASGHVSNFHDLMIDNKDSKKRYRVDSLIETHAEQLILQGEKSRGEKILSSMNDYLSKENYDSLYSLIIEENIKCEVSGSSNWTEVRKFNLMFETKSGAVEDKSNTLYLRPETAQGIFVNFLNVQKSSRMHIPFGIAQIGKAFRNEIIARQFIFRMREFEQMEMQFFIQPGTEKTWFKYWKEKRQKWHTILGISENKLSIHKHKQLAHYATDAIDIQYNFPFGSREIEGIHSRTDFDLKNHELFSNKKLKYFDPKINSNYIPFVIETSVGSDRLFLMILCESFIKEKVKSENNQKERIYLKLHPVLAPFKAAILPLVKKDGLSEIALKVYNEIKYDIKVTIDENQSIGKRYTRQDLIGTPFCITIDHQTKEDETVTIRNRDSTTQERMSIKSAINTIKKASSFSEILKNI